MTNPAQALRLVVLVSGRGSNLQAIIDANSSGALQSFVAGVISNKEDAFALERAANANIPTLVVTSKGKKSDVFFSELIAAADSFKPDFIVLAGFMKILPASFVRHYQDRIINIHPSLLPKFPGLNAQKQALDAKAQTTGCTVHFVDEGCDTGPIILQKEENILDSDTEETLSKRLLHKEHACLIEALQLIETKKVVLQGKKTLLRNTL